MTNQDPRYDETLAESRRLGIPISSTTENGEILDLLRSEIEKKRSETKLKEEQERAKIEAGEMSLRHGLWGKTIANASVCLLALGMFTLGGMLLYRNREGDTDKAIKLILASSGTLLANSGARSLRSLITGEKDSS